MYSCTLSRGTSYKGGTKSVCSGEMDQLDGKQESKQKKRKEGKTQMATALYIMEMGMLGIFAVMLLIMLTVILLKLFTDHRVTEKDREGENGKITADILEKF